VSVTGEQWARLSPAEQAATPILSCAGCGKTKTGMTGDPTDISPSEHCGECPPWRCDDCGEMDSSAHPCSCWVCLAGMPLADVKALFAEDGTFNVGTDGQLSIGRDL
jgi:hypothetical protein